MFFRKAPNSGPLSRNTGTHRQPFLGRLKSYVSKLLFWICRPFLCFELFSTIFHNHKVPFEVPKKIAKHNRWNALSLCYIHLIPILISTFLLVLNFSNVFYQPVGASNQNISFDILQFAAKIHELVITASFSAIVLYYIQYELLHGRGVPLGSLLAGFQVTDIGSLWSPGLWATGFATCGGKRIGSMMIVVLIVLTVILGVAVGPASAILMLPSVGWWNYQISNLYGDQYGFHNSTTPRFLIFANKSTLWPDYVGDTTNFPSICDSISIVDQIPLDCPLGGLSALLGQGTYNRVILEAGNITTQEFTANEIIYNRYIEWRITLNPGAWNDDNIVGWAQTTQLSTSNLLASLYEFQYQSAHGGNSDSQLVGEGFGDTRWSLDSFIKGQLLAPSTFTQCSFNYYTGNIFSGPYSFTANGPKYTLQSNNHGALAELIFPLQNNQTWSSTASPLLELWNSSANMVTLWIEPEDSGENTPSIGLVSATFANGTVSLNESDHKSFEYSAIITTCSVYSYWSPVEIHIEPSTGSYIQATYKNQAQSDVQPIKIDIDWANRALPPNNTVGKLAVVLSSTPSTGNLESAPWELPLGAVTSLFITDVISRIGMDIESAIAPKGRQLNQSQSVYQIPTNYVGELGFDAKDSELTEFSLTTSRYGYSYSMTGITRQLAAGILLFHMLVALIYIFITVRLGWSYYGLKSLCEVVVLAINSSPSNSLNNTSAGIERFDTYKHVVKVREVPGEHLAIVVDDDNMSFVTPTDGKKYR